MKAAPDEQITIIERTAEYLPGYSKIPISFTVESIYRIQSHRDEPFGFVFSEEKVEKPYVKNYDEKEHDKPEHELKRHGVKNLKIYSAHIDSTAVGGCILVYNTERLHMLEGRDDITCLWDIRVHPEYRRQGIGQKLFQAAVHETKKRNCRFMKIETQNINVNGCKFYKKQGCELGMVNKFAYKDYPEEIQFIWYYFIEWSQLQKS